MSTRERGLLYRHQNTLTGELDRLPQAIVGREDAQRLARFLSAGEKVRVRLVMPNRVGGPAEQENVVAEIRGREKPDEYVILGAHLDSWELGTGALDNGCNAALVIEAARVIHATGLRQRRTIRRSEERRGVQRVLFRSLVMPNRVGGPAEQENVVAEIRGREKPDEYVILGAHLDSWELGTGALDNGCNAALVIEAARVIHATGLRQRRTIR